DGCIPGRLNRAGSTQPTRARSRDSRDHGGTSARRAVVPVVVLGGWNLVRVHVIGPSLGAGEFTLKCPVVGLRAVVLEPPCDLGLLCLLTAAPHGVTPSTLGAPGHTAGA